MFDSALCVLADKAAAARIMETRRRMGAPFCEIENELGELYHGTCFSSNFFVLALTAQQTGNFFKVRSSMAKIKP